VRLLADGLNGQRQPQRLDGRAVLLALLVKFGELDEQREIGLP